MKVLCKKSFFQNKCRNCGCYYTHRKILIHKIIEGEIYNVDFDYVDYIFSNWINDLTVAVELNNLKFLFTKEEASKLFYSPEETTNMLRTRMIERMLK